MDNIINNEIDLLEFLKYILGCAYISDLKIEPYNTKAKLLLNTLYSYHIENQIEYALEYIDS